MKFQEPFLLSFSVCWLLICLVPKTVYWRGSHKPVEWPMRIAFAGVGFATLLLWYSLPSS